MKAASEGKSGVPEKAEGMLSVSTDNRQNLYKDTDIVPLLMVL